MSFSTTADFRMPCVTVLGPVLSNLGGRGRGRRGTRESLRICLCAHAFAPGRLDRDLELVSLTKRLCLEKP